MRCRPGPLPFPLAVLLAGLATAQAAPRPHAGNDFFDAAVRHLRRAVTVQRDGSHLARLFSLRQLGDSTLRPLFYQIAQREGWQIQVHAVLGLAEIDPTRRIDPWLVTQVDPNAREALIANAIDMDLIGLEQIRELLEWNELQPMARLLLLGELVVRGETVDHPALAALATNPNLRAAGLAALLLAHTGDPSAFSPCVDRLASLSGRERDRTLLWLFEAAQQYRADEIAPWVRGLLEDPGLDAEVRYWGIYTLLILDPAAGVAAWGKGVGEEPGYRDQVRYGMLLLAAGPEVPAATWDRLPSEHPLIRRMAEVAQALSTGADPADAFVALLDLGHQKTASWAMDALDDQPPPVAARVYEHLIDTVEDDGRGQPERIARAVKATARLFEIDSDPVLRRLREAEDDSLRQEVILLGLFETRSPVAGEAAGGIRRIGAGRADSLALLLMARHARTLAGPDLTMLGRIAAGGGRVSEGLQVQAAWLYLKHTGAIDRALTQIFDGAG